MKRPTALLTLFTFIVSSCGGKSTPPPVKPSPISDQALQQAKDLPYGLDMHVSDGRQGPPAFDRAKLAPATKLADADADQLLARAPAITTDPDDQKAFALRPGSQPAPRTGQTIKSSFPGPPINQPPPKVSDDTGQALRVLRWMPEGKVPLAPELSITFSQPMVAVTSQEDAAKSTPVQLSPTPPGRWRWIGTRTILFDPDVRFPMATTYKVTVPAGTTSTAHNALSDAVAFTFETPPPTVVSSYPSINQPQHLDVPMFVLFDQKIDPAAVLASIHVTANGTPIDLRMLDAAEIAGNKDKQLAAMVESAKKNEQDGRWVAFKAVKPFVPDSAIHVEIGTGTPSAEGPNKTATAQGYDFRTYPPLRIDQSECGWGGPCTPGMPFEIVFDNPLDTEAFDENQIAIAPEIPDVKLVQSGNVVQVMGLTSARTTYTVTVASGVKDDFGQTLGKDTALTFQVGDATPTFYGPQGLVVLDPAATRPTLDFFTTNYDQLDVQLYAVDPSMIDAFGDYLRNQWNHDHPKPMPGKRVFAQKVATKSGKNQLVETALDLAPALAASGLGHAVAIVTPSPWTYNYPPPQLIAWVQSTKLGIDAHVDGDHLLAYATELGTGKPAANVDVEIRPFGIKAKTDDKGQASLPLGATSVKGAHYLTARRGDDLAFVSDQGLWWNEYGGWVKSQQPSVLQWYVTDDRTMYKPGEDVSLKGWLRVMDPGKNGDIGGVAGAVSSVTYKVIDSRGNQILTGAAPVSAGGGFDTKFTLPKTPNLGYTQVYFEANGRMSGSYDHAFQIEEFRRPEFEVSASASQGPFVVGGSGDITVSAKYYSGGPLAGAPASWYVSSAETTYTPPNRDDYIFGRWQPWWGSYDEEAAVYHEPKSWQLTGTTDATGAHVMHLDFLSVKPAMPVSVFANVNVTDVNRQAWNASQAIIVHPSDRYVGLKPVRMFVDKGTPFDLDVIGVDLDGKQVTDAPIEVKATRVDWEFKKGKYKRVEVEPQVCDPHKCRFETPKGGEYEVTATIVDAKGRPNQTKMSFWVSGGDTPAARDVAQEHVQLIPDKKLYAGGDTATLLVQSPFPDAEGVVTWRRSGMVKTEHIALTGSSTTIHVPIADAMVPNLFVQVDLVGMATRTDDKGQPDPKLPRRPAYAVGVIDLPIPPAKRTLGVTVAPSAAKVGPGESAKMAVDVRDAAGQPVAGSEVALIVVDEAILALTGRQFANPIDTFYGQRGPDTADYYERQYVKLARPDANALGGPGGCPTCSAGRGYGHTVAKGAMGGEDFDGVPADAPTLEPAEAAPAPPPKAPEPEKPMAKEERQGQPQPNTPIAVRSNFNPLAAFAPAVKTDATGHAVVEVKVPDNLTRYRIVAIAVAGDKQFGKGESAITARLPLMVRPSPPRFLNFGDVFELPVVVQNQTDSPMTVRLAVRATNAAITEGAGREVTVPPNDRVEVQFPAAAQLAGTARFQIVGTAGSVSDAAELALPVWTPATTEAFATYGVIDDGAIKQPGRAAGQGVAAVRRAGSDDGVDQPPGAHRRDALPGALPVRSAPSSAAAGILAIAALRDVARGVQDEGHAVGRGARGEREDRHRAPVADADRRRRVRVLGSLLPVGAIPDGVRVASARCSTRRTRALTSPRGCSIA